MRHLISLIDFNPKNILFKKKMFLRANTTFSISYNTPDFCLYTCLFINISLQVFKSNFQILFYDVDIMWFFIPWKRKW